MEQRQGLKVACPEEIAYRQGWIDAGSAARSWRLPLAKNGYGQYLQACAHRSESADEGQSRRRCPAWCCSSRRCSATTAGFFFESYNQRRVRTGRRTSHRLRAGQPFAVASQGVLRGLHYQIRSRRASSCGSRRARCSTWRWTCGAASPTFGRWAGRAAVGATTSSSSGSPRASAHGFVVLSETAEFLYKTTDYWAPEHERCIAWNDPAIGIDWPIEGEPSLSAKDQKGVALGQAEVFA
jgi:dTDP-4-dehydrorhamnose 3,5-epimerase